MLKSLSDVYVTVFAPSRLKDQVLYSAKRDSAAYESNKSLETSAENTREGLTERARILFALYQYEVLQRYLNLS